MDQFKKIATTKAPWVKFARVNEISLVGFNVVAIVAGCHVVLINLITDEEIILKADVPEFADGVACFAGHKSLDVFAFAEKVSEPKIRVMHYPELAPISLLRGDSKTFLNMVFSEGELFIGLSSYPACSLEIWKWRTGEKIGIYETNLFYSKQVLATNYSTTAINAVQCVRRTRHLLVWTMLMCGKKCIVTHEKVMFRNKENLNAFSAAVWNVEGVLFTLDVMGHVYQMAADYLLDIIITWEGEGRELPRFCYKTGGMLIQGPNGVIKHFVKGEAWTSDYTVSTHQKVRRMTSKAVGSRVLMVSTKHDILTVDEEKKTLKLVSSNESNITDFCLVRPVCEYLVTLAHKINVYVWQAETGKEVYFLNMKKTPVISICSNPTYPYLALGCTNGSLQFFSCLTGKLEPMCSFQLSRTKINHLVFAERGKILVACNTDIGQFFVIEGTPGEKFHIIASVTANTQIADYILVGGRSCLRLFMIFVTSDKYMAGNNIYRYCIVRNCEPILKKYELENPNRMYTRLYVSRDEELRDRQIYAIPLDSKNLHVLETKRGDTHARIIDRWPTDHLMKRIRYQMDDHNTLSYSYCGLAIVRKPIHGEIIMSVIIHHRQEGGIIKAFINPQGNFIVSLGRDGLLVGTTITSAKNNEEKVQEMKALFNEYSEMFKQKSIGFSPQGIYAGKSWLEYKELIKSEAERIKFAAERKAISAGFKIVTDKARELLTKNLDGPENEYLDIQEFNLDLVAKEQKIKAASELCDRTCLYLERLIREHNRIAKLIKEKYWDTVSTPTKNMWSLFGNVDVQSYCITPFDGEEEEKLRRIAEYRQVEGILGREDIFEPWKCFDESKLSSKLNQVPTIAEERIIRLDDIDELDLDLDLNEEQQAKLREKLDERAQNLTAFIGSTVHNFVKVEDAHYNQAQLQSFYQHQSEIAVNKKEQHKLRLYFNKQFENIMDLKTREMNNIITRNERLRYILSEINYFSEDKLSITLTDPEWRQDETPELLTKVNNSEVGITPYISPSEQALLDAAAAEAERLRLLMLADDFKERALMAMMNGVLEIRWEDELRKEVPIPACMIEKEPETFNEEDLRAIREYEQKVAFLQSERNRYKVMLSAEYEKIGGHLREGVRKFNVRLSELMLHKIQIEAAITQEMMRIHRMRHHDITRNQMDDEERLAGVAITKHDLKMERIRSIVISLHQFFVEVKNALEAVQGREKYLEKAFKREFQDATTTQMEIITKLYKKRPKSNIKSIISTCILVDTAKCIITNERSILLNNDALEFLKLLDTMDKYVGIPAPIDAHMYTNLCRHRRIKIESEIKIRAVQLELAEAETTIAYFQKQLANSKEEQQKLMEILNQIRLRKLKTILNMQLQLVLKEGFVEIKRTGSMDDFEDAIIISRKDVESINGVIIEAGRKKIRAMRSAMHFKKEILLKEWEHKKKRMQIVDLESYYIDIGSVKVTKEIQSYLKARARGENAEKTLSYEHELASLKQRYRKKIDERKLKVEEIDQRLQALIMDSKKMRKEIDNLNVDINECRLTFDTILDEKEKRVLKMIFAAYLKRTKMVTKIQDNYSEITVLQAELELLRMRTVPILEYTIDV